MKTISEQRDHERKKQQKIIDQRFADLFPTWPDELLNELPTHQGADEEECQRQTANMIAAGGTDCPLHPAEIRLMIEARMLCVREGYLEETTQPGGPVTFRCTPKGMEVATLTLAPDEWA